MVCLFLNSPGFDWDREVADREFSASLKSSHEISLEFWGIGDSSVSHGAS